MFCLPEGITLQCPVPPVPHLLRFGLRPLHPGIELVALGSGLQLPHWCGVVGAKLHLLVPVLKVSRPTPLPMDPMA